MRIRVIFRGSFAYDRTGAPDADRPLHQHQHRFLPQTPGFVASEIWICRLRNQILWRRANVRGIPGKASFWLSPPRGRVSLFKTVSQSTVEMKIKEEISGRQTVSIKPHSRLTNKLEEGPKEHAQTAPAKYLDIWIQNNIECQYLFVLKPNIYGRICFIQEIQGGS